ncbi:hypothetical protein [Xanthomarina sp. F2636L]|uniref:hypothetical protein n=1 Tax=Xanthomarina sp. F2636L TaxID=2996018 RepID=UPI00225E53AC|nr:hypothetical protein [Xanthomarina sp. F2636L]MCX7549787.1 hypothetical protein [Xanthomarina sp. F2636L]
MSQYISLLGFLSIATMEQSSIVTALSISVLFFLVLLVLGWRKSYLLRKESDKLNESFTIDKEKEEHTYRDFTESHMYDNN